MLLPAAYVNRRVDMRLPSTALILTGCLIVLSGCGKKEGAAEGGGMGGMPPASVEVMQVQPANVPLQPEYAANTSGSREVEVRAQVGGILLKQSYDDGAPVQEGQILFQIDPKPYQVRLDQAKAQLGQAQAQLLAADRNWKRAEELFKNQAISEKDRDDALSAEDAAKASVALGQAQVRAAQLDLDYTSVKAPISGVTSQKLVSEGTLIGTGASDSLLTRISQLDPLYVNFSYPDAEFMRQKELFAHCGINTDNTKLSATMTFSDGTAYAEKGTIDFTGTTVDRDTGSIQARAVFPNPNHTVLPGQFVRIVLDGLVCRNALLVPADAVMQGPQGAFVYKLDQKNAAQVAPVRTGLSVSGNWIVESGLRPGDTVITKGLIKVMPGAVVNPEKPGQPAGGPPPAAALKAPAQKGAAQ